MDRRSFLRSLGVLGAGAAFGIWPSLDAQAAETTVISSSAHKRYEDATIARVTAANPQDVWVEQKFRRVLSEVPSCLDRAKGFGYFPCFAAVQRATGASVAEQLALAFIETRMGETPEKRRNVTTTEDSIFLHYFTSDAGLLLDASKYDPSVNNRLKLVLAKKDPQCGFENCEQEVLALKAHAFFNMSMANLRMQNGAEQVAQKVRDKIDEAFMPDEPEMRWLVHNVGEPLLYQLIKRPEVKAARIISHDAVKRRGLAGDEKSDLFIARMGTYYTGMTEHFQALIDDGHIKLPSSRPAPAREAQPARPATTQPAAPAQPQTSTPT